MVALLLRLRLQLTLGAFRRSPVQVLGAALAVLYGLGITIVAVATLVGLRLAPIAVAEPIVVLGGALVLLAFLVLPLVLGIDDAMAPRRFALFGIERTRLALGLAVAALVAVPVLAVAVAALATVVTWSRSPVAVLVALVAWPVAVATCALVSRISAGLVGLFLTTRRSREGSTVVGVVLLVLIVPAALLLLSLRRSESSAQAAVHVAQVLGATPLGAVWAAPASIAAGDALGVVQLMIALATLGLLWLAWRGLVGLLMTSSERRGSTQTFGGLGWLGRLPARPGWAIAARSLTYWGRDPRYGVPLLMLPLTPIVIVVVLALAGVPVRPLALLPIPIIALFLGWMGHNDVALDGTAVWLHVVSGVRGSADRLGRAFPVLLLGVPVVVVGSFAAAAVAQRPDLVPALLGASGCLLLCGVGFAFVTSARFPYPAPRPGDSPFQQPNATGGLTVAVQSVTFLVQLLLAAPAVLLGVLAYLHGGAYALQALGAGLGIGALVLLAGLGLGGRAFRRRGPEILAAAVRS